MQESRLRALLEAATKGPWQFDEHAATVRTLEFDPICEVITSFDDGDLIAAVHEIAKWGLAQSAQLSAARTEISDLLNAGNALATALEHDQGAATKLSPPSSISISEAVSSWRAIASKGRANTQSGE